MKTRTKLKALAAAMVAMVASSHAATLWTPAALSPHAWWDAADASTITDAGGGTVQQWDDKSGNGFHATAPNAGQRPLTGTRTIGGLNAIEFDAHTLNFTTIDLRAAPLGREAYAVFHQDDAQDFTVLGGGGNSQMTLMSNQQLRLWKGSNPYNANTQVGTIPVATDGQGGWLANNDFKRFSVNGTLTTTNNTPTGNNMNVSQIGRQQYANADGLIGEIVVTAGQLSAADRALMEGYYAWKWDLVDSLPITHAYKTDSSPFIASAIPEPSRAALLGLGGLALLLRRRRR